MCRHTCVDDCVCIMVDGKLEDLRADRRAGLLGCRHMLAQVLEGALAR